MADETDDPVAPAKSGGVPWLAIALVALVCGGGGAASVFFLAPASTAAGGGEADTAKVEETVAPFGERVLELDPFVVNVGDEGYPRYLKLDLAFELDTPESMADLEQRVPQVRDLTILLLSSRRLNELSDFEGKALLKEDLRERVGALLESGSVESVMFTEFVVQ
jgi:flagellar FliL protein